MSYNVQIAIVMATYQRNDGRIPFYLDRAIYSIFYQTYKNFKLFLIGDKYETESEVLDIIKKYDSSKIFFKNLPYAKEREKYSGRDLWAYGGVNAINTGIEQALSEGYEYICHLDHDDWWKDNHLELIAECIRKTNSDWICTRSTFGAPHKTLPNINPDTMQQTSLDPNFYKYLPGSQELIHSSVCMNFKKISLRYRNLIEETGSRGLPADAELWARVKDYISTNNLNSTFINVLTCRHDEEGFEIKNKIKYSSKQEEAMVEEADFSTDVNITSIIPTEYSIDLLKNIFTKIDQKSFHNHYHILYDIANLFNHNFNYLEIGAYAGGSASLIASHPKVNRIVSIDLGTPISKEEAINNVLKFKSTHCTYTYVQGSSLDPNIISEVKNTISNVDMFFIDGNHKYKYVQDDFYNYKDLVNKNGYIIFDDYMDEIHSPEVKLAVDDLVKNLSADEYQIIGSLKYDLIKKTNCPQLKSSNLFILKKL